jgi:hypothetical protein
VIQSSRTAGLVAIPGEDGKMLGSAAGTRSELHEGVVPGGIVRRQACSGDRDQAPAVGKTCESRRDVAQGGVGDAALDMGSGREGRVHQHDRRTGAGIEMVVDMRRVVARNGSIRKQGVEKIGAGVAALIESEPRSGKLGEDC